jgi:predicted RNase H-like HicB family nuclease
MARRSQASQPRAPHRRVVGLRVRGRVYRAVLTPDRKVGGYTVRVPSLPGCLTEGDSLEEAKRMAREAIALWVASATPVQTVRNARTSK